MLVEFSIKLKRSARKLGSATKSWTNKVQDGDFHHALVEVCCPVFHDLYCNDFLSFQVLAFDDLPKGALAKHVKDQITISGKDKLATFACLVTYLATYLWPLSSLPKISLTYSM